MHEIGVRPRGSRLPGGRLPPSPELLANLGFTHCSLAGRGIGFLDNLVVLPFEWRLIDAYHYLPRFGGLREVLTGSSAPLPPVRLRATISAALEGIVRDGGQENRFEIMHGALEELRVLVEDGVIWCTPHQDVASWVRGHPEDFGDGLELDPTEA